MKKTLLKAFLIFGVLSASDFTYANEPNRQAGDIGVDATLGLAAGYGLIGGNIWIAASPRFNVGVTSGVDIYNTHVGIRALYYALPESKTTPIAYVGISQSRFKEYKSSYASLGVGGEMTFDTGYYLQLNAGFAFYLTGENAEGNAPGFFEFRPVTIGYRF